MTVEEFIEQIANLENKDNTLNCSQYEILVDIEIKHYKYKTRTIEKITFDHNNKTIHIKGII